MDLCPEALSNLEYLLQFGEAGGETVSCLNRASQAPEFARQAVERWAVVLHLSPTGALWGSPNPADLLQFCVFLFRGTYPPMSLLLLQFPPRVPLPVLNQRLPSCTTPASSR